MDLTPKQQTSEAIRQAETILVITGQHPSVDQAAAVIALSAILRKFGKKVTAIVTDNPPAAVQMLDTGAIDRGLGGLRDFVLKVDVTKAEVDKLRYEVQDGKLNIYLTPFKGSFAPSDVTFGYGAFHYDLAIVLGVPTRARIDRIYEQNADSFETIPVVNLDFHRSNENYGAVNLIEPNASSLCEMLVALSESLQSGIVDAEIATALLMGIVASTDRFTATHTSPKSLTVAAQMMAAGAKQQAVVRALYRDGKASEPRGERGGERSGGSDRGERERGGDRGGAERNNSAGASAPSRASAPAAKPAAQSEPRTAPQQASAAPAPQAPVAQAPAPAAPARPAPASQPRVAEEAPAQDESLIIEPSHIELSSPQAAEPSSAAGVAMAQQPQVEQAQPEQREPERREEPEQTPPVQPELPRLQQTDRPQAMPVADFAAAAEMFRPAPAMAEAKPEREQS